MEAELNMGLFCLNKKSYDLRDVEQWVWIIKYNIQNIYVFPSHTDDWDSEYFLVKRFTEMDTESGRKMDLSWISQGKIESIKW